MQFSVAGGGTSIGPVKVNYDGNSTTASLATALFIAFPSNSLVTMSNPNGSSSFTLTTIATSSGANSTTISTLMVSSCTPSSSQTCGGVGWTMTLSGPNLPPTTASTANFSGGQDPVYQTAYDNGSTTITVNSHPDTYAWSGSATTGASIAQGLCNAINADTAAFATASTNGIAGQCPLGSTTVSLASRNNGQNYTLAASSSSVANSFSVSCPGFPNCTSASLTGGGSAAYSFTLGRASDGQINSANDLVDGNWIFGYDQFNRLISSNMNSGQQTFTYDYDVAGNRWHQNAPQGGPAPQYVFDNNNHLVGSGVTYDADGNELTDGLGNTFTWDGAGRLSQVSQGGTVVANYVYDAEGRRVRGPNGQYIYDLAGHMITQMGLNGVWNYGEIYAAGRHLATYSGGTTNFMHQDWVGSKRVMTALNGTVSQTCTGFAFGDGVNCTGSSFNWSFNGFTDHVHDPETNLEHTLFRKLSGTQGRWLSPDAYGGADITNPQALNRYSYVMDDPVNAGDPWGLVRVPGGWVGDPGTGFGSNWNEFDVLFMAFTPTFGIIVMNPEFPHGDWDAMLYLYYGNWDIASLILNINLSTSDAIHLGRQLGPNGKSMKTCKDALKKAHADMRGVQRANDNWDTLSGNNGIEPEELGAIGLRESDFRPNAIQADGHGRGAFQIDCCGDVGDRPPAHPNVSQAQAFDLDFASDFASGLLASSQRRWSNLGNIAGPASIREYNAGSRYTLSKSLFGVDALDRGTTGNNYVSNTIGLMDCFQ